MTALGKILSRELRRLKSSSQRHAENDRTPCLRRFMLKNFAENTDDRT